MKNHNSYSLAVNHQPKASISKKLALVLPLLSLLFVSALAYAGEPCTGPSSVNTFGKYCFFYGGDFNPLDPKASALANENDASVGGSPYGAATYQNFFWDGSPHDVTGLFTNNLSTLNPTAAYWEIRAGVSPGNPGTLLASGTATGANFRHTKTNRTAFGYQEYTDAVAFPAVSLSKGQYWFAVVPNDPITPNGRSFNTNTFNCCIGSQVSNQQYLNSTYFSANFANANTLGAGVFPTFSGGVLRDVPACVPDPANMVAWYSFDKSGALQQDRTSYNNTATAYGTFTTVTGEVSNALHFDGASAYVQAVSQPQLNMGTGNFSIDAWVKIANSADYSGVVVLLDKRDSSTGYHMYIYNGKPGLQLADPSGYTNFTSAATIPADNQWHLLAVTVVRNSATGGTWYLDGVSVGNFDPTARTGSLNSVAPLVIAVRSANQGGGGFFKGGIDELEIFNRALSSTEVLSLMNAGPAGKC